MLNLPPQPGRSRGRSCSALGAVAGLGSSRSLGRADRLAELAPAAVVAWVVTAALWRSRSPGAPVHDSGASSTTSARRRRSRADARALRRRRDEADRRGARRADRRPHPERDTYYVAVAPDAYFEIRESLALWMGYALVPRRRVRDAREADWIVAWGATPAQLESRRGRSAARRPEPALRARAGLPRRRTAAAVTRDLAALALANAALLAGGGARRAAAGRHSRHARRPRSGRSASHTLAGAAALGRARLGATRPRARADAGGSSLAPLGRPLRRGPAPPRRTLTRARPRARLGAAAPARDARRPPGARGRLRRAADLDGRRLVDLGGERRSRSWRSTASTPASCSRRASSTPTTRWACPCSSWSPIASAGSRTSSSRCRPASSSSRFPSRSLGLLRDRVTPLLLWVVALAIALAPTLQIQTASAVADVPLAVFFALAGVAAWRWIEGGESEVLWLRGVLAAAAVATKVEGARLRRPCCSCCRRGGSAAGRRPLRPRSSPPRSASPLTAAPWELWSRVHYARQRDLRGRRRRLRRPGSRRAGRLPRAAEALARELADPSSWLALVALAAACGRARPLRRCRPRGRALHARRRPRPRSPRCSRPTGRRRSTSTTTWRRRSARDHGAGAVRGRDDAAAPARAAAAVRPR